MIGFDSIAILIDSSIALSRILWNVKVLQSKDGDL